MSRLIDADAIPWRDYLGDDEPRVYRSQIEAMPTIDPVKHARWGHDVLDLSLCSCCLESFKTKATKGYRFCPSCGAKMDGIGADQDAKKTTNFDGEKGKKPSDCKDFRGGPDCGMDGEAHE